MIKIKGSVIRPSGFMSTFRLFDLGQATLPLWDSVSPFIKEKYQENVYLAGLLNGSNWIIWGNV